jgi:pyrimidine operon attenuation protein/uracil phosphoribosyltransferase
MFGNKRDGVARKDEMYKSENMRTAPDKAACVLETGRLDVTYSSDGDLPIFGFGERNNPRRSFLFVSHVLGRHIPVSPAVMRAAFTRMADTIPADLPGPVVMTGMAETAVGLGAGVHDAWIARTGREDAVFVSTTRAQLGGPLLTTFREEHSHASDHLVHLPQHPVDLEMLRCAQTLVMVDDEASSGDTFRNLAAGLVNAGLDRIAHVHTAVLTDWSGPAGDRLLPHRPDIAVTRGALVRGSYRWTPAPMAPVRTLPDADLLRQGAVRPIRRDDDGRLGRSIRSACAMPKGLCEAIGPKPARILVIGTGEHVWEPFLLAEALEQLGHDVRFGSTTRSPILPGHAILRGYVFRDHEGLGITNYLYNVDPNSVDRVILCVDTALTAIDSALLAALGSDVVEGAVFHDRRDLAELTRNVAPATKFVLEAAGQ